MKTYQKFKKLSLATTTVAVMFGLASSAVWAKTNLSELHSELQIMSGIMKTAMAQGENKNGIRLRGLEVTYLSAQGVVFELNSSAQNRHFSFSFDTNNEFVLAPELPPIPPLPVVGDEEHEVFIEFDDEHWSEEVEESLRLASGAMNKAREKLRELNQQEREIAWEQREYKRRLRDIEFEMRTADSQRKANLQEQKAELDAELAELKKRQSSVDKYAEQLEADQKQQAEQRLMQRKQQYSAFLTQFEDNVTSTLCKYGNGFKALPSDENVTFVLSNLGSAVKSGSEDRIYVFKNKDIQSCVKDKITPKQLLSNADAYLF
ncbi:hypothetical protein Q4567_12355 [Aliiglaciecola sp. 2_MG-2023]|uniref:hypothetical protein n=1 Tax=unclassified Aliiglaciecola TaxID=2593648 RepID=UPI0026E427AB|nr:MULTISPECIES: hypothetical protein [unclassified Aliiglaciecola]MDO6711518.1 hypothetical protein [Aliiglaciecola sp. 2_MG-2023]MDO6752506.1 hypothetical protein [Aliiglaciecola sp. 1_MG-2023]